MNALVVGLTGQSGAGKTTVCEVFCENGFCIINADMIARQLMECGTLCLKEVAEAFENVIDGEGNLDRKALAQIVFSDKGKLDLLNSITYPYITARVLTLIEEMDSAGKQYILLDAPTLFESRADDFCDLIISVIATETSRRERITKRDGITEEQAQNRMSAQHSDNFYTKNSDFIIKNNKSVRLLREKAKEVSDKIKQYRAN